MFPASDRKTGRPPKWSSVFPLFLEREGLPPSVCFWSLLLSFPPTTLVFIHRSKGFGPATSSPQYPFNPFFPLPARGGTFTFSAGVTTFKPRKEPFPLENAGPCHTLLFFVPFCASSPLQHTRRFQASTYGSSSPVRD